MFFIKKVGIKGNLGDSYLDIKKGLNVVYGSSNTGKSIIVECIDYAIGDKDYNIDLEGYNTVYLVLSHPEGDVTISRKLGATTVDIESKNRLVVNGHYSIKKNHNNKEAWFLDDFLLELSGIPRRQPIVVSQKWQKQDFTFRTCLNSFIVKQENIIRRESPYLPLNNSAAPSYKSGLLYLWLGENFIDSDDRDNLLTRRLKKSAIEGYINELMTKIKNEHPNLEEEAKEDTVKIENEINLILDKISENEKVLSGLFDEARNLAHEILTIDGSIAEYESLLVKYNALNTQYAADMKRLNLVIEGEAHSIAEDDEMTCPFCNGKLEKSIKTSCIEAAQQEIYKLVPKIKDLSTTIDGIKNDLERLKSKRDQINKERKDILSKINYEIKPLISKLKSEIDNYKEKIKKVEEAKTLLEQTRLYKDKITDLQNKEVKNKNELFDVMSHYNVIIPKLQEEYGRLLKKANYHFNETPVFKNFDYIIDGKQKRTQGQGFRAYLNALAVLALYNCLWNEGIYPMPFLAMDSPIQSLVEKEGIPFNETMRFGLFQCLKETSANKQVIVVENKIPSGLDLSGVNVIEFTKDEETGRYGFAQKITD